MRTFVNHNSVCFGVIMLVFLLFLGSCTKYKITSFFDPPQWIEIKKVSSKRLDLRWESVERAKQYAVYKIFSKNSYYTERELENYASKYEVARTDSPEYQYEGSYDPRENGYTDRDYSCYFGVRVVDENGNMSRVKFVSVP